MPPIEEEKRRKEIESETQRLRSDIEAESKKSREEMDTLFAKQDKDLKREQRINSAKKIGGTALKGAGAAVGFVGGATIGALSDLGRNSSGGSRGHDNSEELSEGSLVLLFLLATASHFFDAIKGFQRPGFMIYIYVVLLVIAYISVFKMRIGGPEEIALVIVIALAYALPYIPRLFPDNQLMLTISGLLFLIPILPLYLGLKFPNHSIIEIGSRWYMIFWVIVMIFFVLTTFAIDQKNEKLVSNPMLGVQFVIEGVSKTISKVSHSFQDVINNAVYTVTDQPNPGKQESLVGVYVEKVKPLESRYTKDSRVFIQAKIRAVNVKEPLKITTLCHIDGVKQGVTKPSVLNDVVGNYDNYFTCELGNLPPGTYTVKMQADFEFPTSSDIEYVFVNSDIKDDQFQRLGIQPNVAPVGTYTGGPVSLGLTSLTQPLRVYLDDNYDNSNAEALDYPFGISLENKWSQGKVVRGINYTLETPSDIRLIDCTREPFNSEEPNDAGRNIYHFIMNSSNSQESFDAVQCRMYAADIRRLLSNDANTRTFAGKARYEYMVEGTTVVTIEQ